MPPTPAPEAAAPGPGPAPQSRSPGRQPRSVAKDAKVDAIAALTFPRDTIAICLAGAVPGQPGVYATYGNASVWRVLELGEPPDDRPLYVGKAEDTLAARDLNAHFATGATRVRGHEILPVGGHWNSPWAAANSPHGRPRISPPVLS